MSQKVKVSNEISALRRVIVHRPDQGIARISPKRAEELLFDDIVHLPAMQEEHDIFTKVLAAFLGEDNVLETQTLLLEALNQSKERKNKFIDVVFEYEELPSIWKDWLYQLDTKILAEVLITGYLPEKKHILFDPIPNFIFTRDIAVTVNDHIIITKAAKTARERENLLTRFIFTVHPEFDHLQKQGRIINLNDLEKFPPSNKGETVSIEGGDMMIINKDYILIGCSERTTKHAVHSLRDILFEKGVIANVVQVNIPNDRSCMHIDTLFTQVDEEHVVAFKPIVMDGLGSSVLVHKNDGTTLEFPTVEAFFKDQINPNIKFIAAGNGESPYQEREQWTDGCNLVTLKPGVAVTYDRNPKTSHAFESFGFNVIHANDFLKGIENGTIKAETVTKTIINLPSYELSRARGGSHCMTCPILRD